MPPVPASLKTLLTSLTWWVGAGLSVVLFLFVRDAMTRKAHNQLAHEAALMQASLQSQLNSYIHILQTSQAFIQSRGIVTREEFHHFSQQLNFVHNYPSLKSLNFATYLTHDQRPSFESRMRAQEQPGKVPAGSFSIRPDGERAHYHVITYLEPPSAHPSAIGVDILARATQSEALNLMRDTGRLITSGQMIHVSTDQPYFAMALRLPLYRKGFPLLTVEDRRAAMYGSVGIGIDVHNLMRKLSTGTGTAKHVQVRILDTGFVSEIEPPGMADSRNVVFDSHPDSNDKKAPAKALLGKPLFLTLPMTVASREWEMEFRSNCALMLSRIDHLLSYLLLALGLGSSALLCYIFHSPHSARRRAVKLASEMTKDLRRSESHLAEAQRMANLGSWQLDASSQAMQWSLETFRILGRSPTTSLGFDDFLKHVHEEDRQTVKDGLEQALLNSAEFDYEHRIVRQDGSVRWVHTLCHPVKNDRRKKVRGTIMDITERKITMQALQRSQELLRELTAHQDRIKEEERRRIAREIHDELGQTLLALRIDISMLEARTSQRHPRLNARIRTALQQLDATVRAVRGIINDLRPSVLDLGLVAAIEWQVAEFRRRSDIECELFIDDPEITVDNDSATTLFRILQESLTNIIRHAHASRIAVALYSQDGWLTLKIMDNGVGMAPDEQKKPESFGLVGIEERVIALNGRFSITSMPNSGTTLLVAIPLDRDEKASFTTMRRALVRDIDFLPRSTQ